MLVTKSYIRERAVEYASKWAFSRNPLFYDYTGIGGNCTNFVSQCLYAGSCTMNFTPVYGWSYLSDRERTASWTGVEFLYNFLAGNKGTGPFGHEVGIEELLTGDVVQLGREKEGFYHTLLVVGFSDGVPLLAAQSNDAFGRPLDSYTYDFARYIHVDGVRQAVPDTGDCFESVYNGIAIIPDSSAETTPPPAETPAPTPSETPAPAETPAPTPSETPAPAEAPAPTPQSTTPDGGAVLSPTPDQVPTPSQVPVPTQPSAPEPTRQPGLPGPSPATDLAPGML